MLVAQVQEYDASEIQVLEGLEAVRKRPGMYIGSTSIRGLHQCVYEIIDNSIDEAMAGFGAEINVTIHKDGSMTVLDHGRGIPVDMHKSGKPALEVVLTELHAGGKFGGGGYKVAGGLHGVGASCVNALSSRFEVNVRRDGHIHHMSFSRGKVTQEMEVTGNCRKNDTGTEITFWPDAEMFETTDFDYKVLRSRFRELAFLNKNVTIIFTDERDVDEETGKPHTESYHYEGGIKTFVEELGKKRDALINEDVIYINAEYHDRIIKADPEQPETQADDLVEVALQWNDSYTSRIYSFVNNINTEEGGTHLNGFYLGLTDVMNNFAHEKKVLKDDQSFSRDDATEGLVAVVSIKFMEPQFEGQTKGKLGSTEARKEVRDAVVEFLTRFFEQHPDQCDKVLEKIGYSAKVREEAKKARDRARNANKIKNSGTQRIEKLANCSSKDAKECEIFLVEGDSAGGSAKSGRNRRIQAILPLRGKILNVEKASLDAAFKSQEIVNMQRAFGCGINEQYNESKLHYHKIIIMTDADVDGAHIRCLLLTFFYRYMKPLIDNGHVYIAQPPLFRIKKGKQMWYTYSDEEQAAKLKEVGMDGVTVQRYKGLGEMNPEQLYETTMDPEKRTLVQCTVRDAAEADDTISLLMGDQVPPRRKFIVDNAHLSSLDF